MKLLVIAVVLVMGAARFANTFEMQCGFADVENLVAATAIPSCPKAYSKLHWNTVFPIYAPSNLVLTHFENFRCSSPNSPLNFEIKY